MEIRTWFDQQLVIPVDMRGTSSDMYQRNYDNNNFPPMILWGLRHTGTVGNTISFSIGAARAQELTVSSYPYLPTPTYGTGYPAIIEIPTGHNSITLDPSINPCFIVATYSINPTSPGQKLYTTTGVLAQVSSVNPLTDVILAHASYSGSAWTIDQTPGTNRNNDMTALSALQYDLSGNQLQLGSPQGLTSVQINLLNNVLAIAAVSALGGFYDASDYLINSSQVDVPTTLTPIDALVSGSSMVRFTGALATTVNGIVAGISQYGAQHLTIYNASSASITFVDNSGSATAPDRISTPAGNITLGAKYSLDFFYDNIAQLWIPKLAS